MRVSATKTKPRVAQNQYLSARRIKGYGEGNDYPQKILQINASSGTGRTCYDIYVKFIRGAGFTDENFANTVINDNKERVSSLLKKFSKDLESFNGFACLIKYDYKGLPFAYYNIPFEHCRIEINQDKSYTGRIAVYSDWTGLTGKRFDERKVTRLTRFNPENAPQEILEVGGPENYLGQIFYYTSDGEFEYPISPFDSIVTDMLTEESVSTVKYRNAKYNFLPAGILVRKGIKPITMEDGTIDPNDPFNKEQASSAESLKNMQSDENACKIGVVDVDADEEAPEFIPFEFKNYDKQFEYTENTVQENIGRMFKVPPILRGVDVGAGFGAELMSHAYNFMNSVTEDERADLETAFKDLFEIHPRRFTDFSIKPKEYIVKGGSDDSSSNEG